MNPYLTEDLEWLSTALEQSALPNHTVFITGASGLVGSLLVKAILVYNRHHPATQITVYAGVRDVEKLTAVLSDTVMPEELTHRNVYSVVGDISLPLSLPGPCEYIIHTAAPTASRYFLTNPVEVIDSICQGTKQVLELAKAHQVKGMVVLSSMEVFGVVGTEQRRSENELGYLDLQNIRSCYSEGKRLAECLCAAYAAEYAVPVTVARLAQTFGAGVPAGENRVFAQFARSAVKGENIVLHTTGESVGNYCYTADAIRALLLLLEKGEAGQAYTVVNEDMTMSIRSMAELVAREFSNGRSEVVLEIPKENVYGYAPQTKLHLSGKKLRALGWVPTVNMQEAYTRMLSSINL